MNPRIINAYPFHSESTESKIEIWFTRTEKNYDNSYHLILNLKKQKWFARYLAQTCIKFIQKNLEMFQEDLKSLNDEINK